jgi:hypothetical protein
LQIYSIQLLDGIEILAFLRVLYKKIKIAQYQLHLTWKQEQDKEMQFQKCQVTHKKSPKLQPVIPLIPKTLLLDKLEDKAVYITFLHQEVSKGSGLGLPNYKKSIRTFEEGDPQQWMEVITGLKGLGSEFDHGTNRYVQCGSATQGSWPNSLKQPWRTTAPIWMTKLSWYP